MDGSNKIYNFLMENDKNINWEKSFKSLLSMASLCSVTLIRINFTLKIREEEKKNKSNRKSSKDVEKIVDELAACYADKAEHRISDVSPYYPIIKSNKKPFNDEDTIQIIKSILCKDFALPSTQFKNVPKFLLYSLTLMGVFNSLFHNYTNGIPKIIDKFIILLNELCSIVSRLFNELEKIEKTGDQKSKNASTWTPKKLGEYKKHDQYPQLEQLINFCQDTPTQTEVASINRILEIILKTKNKVTLRRYRHILFQEIKG